MAQVKMIVSSQARPHQHNHWRTHESCSRESCSSDQTYAPWGDKKLTKAATDEYSSPVRHIFSFSAPTESAVRCVGWVTESRYPGVQRTKYYKFVASAAQTNRFFYCQTRILNRYFPVPPFPCTFSSQYRLRGKLFGWFLFENISYDTACRHA